MPDDAELEINVSLFKALNTVLKRKPTEPEPVVLLATYLLSLAQGYGLSDSQHLKGHHLERVGPPPQAAAFISHCIANADIVVDAEIVRERLYSVFVELSQDEDARTALNRAARISDVGLRKVAQVCWNIDATSRPMLPIQPRVAKDSGSLRVIDIPVKVSGSADFATMNWTERIKEGIDGLGDGRADRSSKAALRDKAAVLAVLAAQRLLDSSAKPWPTVDGATFKRTQSSQGTPRLSIVWLEAGSGLATPSEIGTYSESRGLDSTGQRLMPMLNSKARAYFAIDSFEQDLRRCIELFLLDHLRSEDVLSAEHDALSARRASDDVSETRPLTEYLSPQQAYDVLLRHAAALPAALADQLWLSRATLDRFVAVRNRVMHRRSLQPDDLVDTESFIGHFRSQYFPQTEAAVAQLDSDSSWQPRPRVGSAPAERIPHNLPESDFDETGLLGRERQVEDIVEKVKQRRERMFTLVGEGGIGKTALALEVCYRLVDDAESPFDAILWTSLKSEELTPAGVRHLSGAIRDMSGATSALGQVVERTFQGSEHELADALGGRTTLIVIDNLETAQGREVLRLWDALPVTVSFLFTSRVGVGEIERRIPVGPLELESAEELFRKFARTRGQSELARLSAAVLEERLSRLRYSPLAIRWYILSVESGKAPTDTLRNQEDLLRYCVGNVVDALSDDERLLLGVLRALDRSVSFDELAVFSEMALDTLRRGYQRLAQSSLLVLSKSPDDEESDAVTLSSTARAFLPTVGDPLATEDVVRREFAYIQELDLQRARIADKGRYLDVNVIFERSPGDGPTAHLLRQALHEDKSGRPQAASATMARARALNSEYFEVDRVDAFLAAVRRETVRATTLYRSALSLCGSDEEHSWVGYFFAGHLARQASDLPAAIGLAEKAHAFFNGYDSALQLGNFYVWDHRFDEGKQLIESALERAPKPKFQRIATTSLVECFRRWSEAELEDRLAHEALDRAVDGIEVGLELHEAQSTDDQLMLSIIRAAVAALQATRQMAEIEPEAERRLASTLQRFTSDARFRLLSSWRQLVYAASSLPVAVQSRLALGIVDTVSAGPEKRILGSVFSSGPKYGFIAHPELPDKVYFNAGSLRAPTRIEDLEAGSRVEFTRFVGEKGQDQALDVILVERDVRPALGAH